MSTKHCVEQFPYATILTNVCAAETWFHSTLEDAKRHQQELKAQYADDLEVGFYHVLLVKLSAVE